MLHETLAHLATRADRQAARAAAFADVPASSDLLALADELRVMSTTVERATPQPPITEFLAAAQQRIALATLKFDAQEWGARRPQHVAATTGPRVPVRKSRSSRLFLWR